MEPELIVVEDCDTFFIVQQRWGYYDSNGANTDSMHNPPFSSVTLQLHAVHETAFIMGRYLTYAKAYRQWVSYDNRNRADMRFGYIVEARTKQQVVDAMLARGHASQFRCKMHYPIGFNAYYQENNTMRITDPSGAYNNSNPYVNGATIDSLQRTQAALLTHAANTAAALQQQIDRLVAMPAEPKAKGENPNVISFEKRFAPGGRLYTYAAIKAGDGLWYTTGPRTPKGFTWESLIQWIMETEDTLVLKAAKFTVL